MKSSSTGKSEARSTPLATEIVPYHDRTERPERVGEIHLSKSRREILAEYKAQGRLLDDQDYRQAAALLGVDIETVRKWDGDDSVNVRAMQKFQPRAFQSLVRNWPVIEQCMKDKKSWAFKLAAQISTVLPVGGVSFQQNVAIDARASGVSENASVWAKNHWQRVREHHTKSLPIEVTDESDPDAA